MQTLSYEGRNSIQTTDGAYCEKIYLKMYMYTEEAT